MFKTHKNFTYHLVPQAAQEFPDGFIDGESFQRLFDELDKEHIQEVTFPALRNDYSNYYKCPVPNYYRELSETIWKYLEMMVVALCSLAPTETRIQILVATVDPNCVQSLLFLCIGEHRSPR